MTRSRRQVEAARKKRVQGKRAKAAGKKDPGVPQLGRFAAHVQQQNENRQKRAAEAKRRREEAREKEVGGRRSLAGLQRDALRRQREFERKEVGVSQPDAQEEASLRQYGRELRKVLAASDVVLEVLDARDPQGCRSPQLEAAVRRAGHRQRLVLVLNKIDLVPRDVVAAWLKYLRGEFPTVAFKACTQQQSRNLKQSRLPVATAPEEVLAGGACVGADCLLRVLANYSRSGEVKTTITVGVVGYPNVGKSSLINSLKRSRACGVGATPGVTRCLQAVQLDRHIQLLDCPGVVMETGTPPAAAPLRGALDPQRLRDPLGPAAAILRRCPPEQLRELYGVPPCADPRQFLSHLARRQGRLRPGGLPDPHAAAVALLRDWTSGKISYYTRPPETRGEQLEAQILTALGPALDLEALERGDAEALAAVPATVTGIGLSPCVPEAEEEEEKSGGEEETAMEDEEGDLELGAVTVELKPRVKTGGCGEGVAPRAPRLEEVAALDPLLQGQGLRAASKRRKKLQKRAELAWEMSQRKRCRLSGFSQGDDGDEDFNLTQTPTHSQVQRNLERRSQDQVNQKVSELVQFLLVKDQKKIPIKRADILKKVIREYKDVYSEIVNRAGRTLQQVFGLQLVEIDTKHHIYILTSDLPRAEGENMRRDNQTAKLGLLIVILSFIFMKGNSVKDGAVWEFLRRLRLQPGERHEVFGDVKKLVTEEFVRQKYLEITPIPLTDPPEFKYQWGPRAAKETSKRDVLRFVAKIQGKDPTFWTSQYNEAEATP